MSSDRFQRILIDLNAPLKNLVKSADHYVARSEQHEQKRWPVALAHWNRLSSVCSGPKSCCLESVQSLNFRFHISPCKSTYHKLLELVSKELNHLAAILHVYAGGLNFMK